ncbi:MAG: DUF2878 domain-containing protein [Ketobacteraceae bacterium]|nr:DUF2878 domain-containing protein [Ketobacteraceae bacterium]
MAISKLTVYNFAFFQGAWLACVMLASPWALAAVSPFVVIQLIWGEKWQRDMRTGISFVLLGALAESFLLGTGSVTIPGQVRDLPPLWLLCLWFCFGISTRYSLAWLRSFSRYKLLWQVLISAALAPFAYLGAEKLGAIELHDNSLISIAVTWGVILPVCLLVTDREARKNAPTA